MLSEEDKHLLIRSGRLKFLLHEDQQMVFDQFVAWRNDLVVRRREKIKLPGRYPRVFAVDCSRRYGKDWFGLVVMCARAIQKKNASLLYAASHKKGIEDIVNSADLLKKLTDEFPLDCRPVYKTAFKGQSEGLYFPNGSTIRLVGLDLQPDNLRGTGADGICISEAAFVADLDRTVETVLLPQFMGRDDAFLLMNSTPGESGQSPWDTEFVPDARDRGAYVMRTIWDAPQYPDQEKYEMLRIDGDEVDRICAERNYNEAQRKQWLDQGCPLEGKQCLVKPRQQREYLCIRTRESDTVVIPEFEHRIHVRDFEVPKYCHAYTVCDPGVKDLCAINYIAWDFNNARMLVLDEFTRRNANTNTVAENINKQEQDLWAKHPGFWNGSNMQRNPYQRYSDIDLRMITDLKQLHGLEVVPVRKDDAESALHELRNAFQDNKIWIHPRCKVTAEHMAGAMWNKSRTSYTRTDRAGHWDHVDVLKYAWRSISRSKNPHPPGGWIASQSTGADKLFVTKAHMSHPNGLVGKLNSLFPSTWARKR